MNRTDFWAFHWGLLVVAALLTAAGCGGSEGPPRYDLEGAVQFDGQPVPAGEVFLQPDASRGNAGPGSLALIKDGRYQTDPDKGVVGGPYVVRILGFDGVPVGDSSTGKSLFPQYETQVEFPKEATTHDFAIPRVSKPGP
jgi:hypothetical protein